MGISVGCGAGVLRHKREDVQRAVENFQKFRDPMILKIPGGVSIEQLGRLEEVIEHFNNPDRQWIKLSAKKGWGHSHFLVEIEVHIQMVLDKQATSPEYELATLSMLKALCEALDIFPNTDTPVLVMKEEGEKDKPRTFGPQ